MRRDFFPVVLLSLGITVAASVRLEAQVKFGGEASFEYLKGQTASEFAHGSIENVRAGFMAAGVISSKFGFTLEARSWGVSTVQLEQAWIGLVPSKAFNIKAGLYLVPFGGWNQASRPYQTLLVGTPLNLEFLYPQSWRDIGLIVDGQVGVVTYAAYVGNGLKLEDADSLRDGQQFSDNNKDKAVGGRVGLTFSQGIEAAVSYYTGKYDNLNERRLTLEGADFRWMTPQWEVRAEATRAIIKNPESFGEGKCEGYAVWAVMSFAHLQPVGSFQKVKYTDPFHGGGIALDLSRWTAGFRYVFAPNLFLKAEYEWNLETPTLNNNLIRIQAALGF
jgi:hypothetical protein